MLTDQEKIEKLRATLKDEVELNLHNTIYLKSFAAMFVEMFRLTPEDAEMMLENMAFLDKQAARMQEVLKLTE